MRRAFQLLLTAVVTWLILRLVGVSRTELAELQLDLPDGAALLLAVATLVLLAGFFLSARYWGWMVREFGAPDPGTATSLRVVFASNLGRYLPGKVWQLAGLALLARRSGVPVSTGTAAGVVGQVFALAGAGIVSVPLFIHPEGAAAGELLLPVTGLALALALLSIPATLRWGLQVLFRLVRIPEAHLPQVRVSFGPRWMALHALIWIGHGSAFAILVHGLGYDASFLELAPAFTAAYLLGYLALFAPAGLGVREGFLIAFLSPSLGSGAVVVALAARLWMTVVDVVPAGMLALWELYRAPTDRSTPGSGGDDHRA